MKKTTVFLLALLATTLVFGQIDDILMKANWKAGKEKVIYGNKIFRHEGKNDIGGVTNVGFQTFEQVKSDLEKKAEKEMWTPEKKKEAMNLYEKFAGGGIIHLYLTRLTIAAANTDMFTIIIKDSTNNNEILRKDLESDLPNTPFSGSSYWWNYSTISIPDKVNGKIFIYVIDKLGLDNNKFKFEVTL